MLTPDPHRARLPRRSVSLLVTLTLAACASTKSLAPFTTDGCSLFPDRSLLGKTDWCDCCLAHDLAYWRGGTEDERLRADQTLRACVEQKTRNHALAEAMYLGVRAGGGPQINSPFRWGYGWPYGRGYQPLDDSESAAVWELERTYRAANPELQCKADASIVGTRAVSKDASQAPDQTGGAPVSRNHPVGLRDPSK